MTLNLRYITFLVSRFSVSFSCLGFWFVFLLSEILFRTLDIIFMWINLINFYFRVRCAGARQSGVG